VGQSEFYLGDPGIDRTAKRFNIFLPMKFYGLIIFGNCPLRIVDSREDLLTFHVVADCATSHEVASVEAPVQLGGNKVVNLQQHIGRQVAATVATTILAYVSVPFEYRLFPFILNFHAGPPFVAISTISSKSSEAG
jgi:hypothetical protein